MAKYNGWTKETTISYCLSGIKSVKEIKASGGEPSGGYDKRMAFYVKRLKDCGIKIKKEGY